MVSSWIRNVLYKQAFQIDYYTNDQVAAVFQIALMKAKF